MGTAFTRSLFLSKSAQQLLDLLELLLGDGERGAACDAGKYVLATRQDFWRILFFDQEVVRAGRRAGTIT